ncbi:MAG TPA: hypothetical protein VGH28_26845 [Polyangiaceae bacterium]|jgi:hypothetical protein
MQSNLKKSTDLEAEHVDLVDDDPLEEVRAREPAHKPPAMKHAIALAEWIALIPRHEKLTRWKNPTTKPVRLHLLVRGLTVRGHGEYMYIPQIDEQLVVARSGSDEHGGRVRKRISDMDVVPSVWCDIEIAAGGEIELPRSQDVAILDIRDGKIVGGGAPQLRPVNRALNATPCVALDPREIEAARRRDIEAQELKR